jgi:hypothetical protein
MTRRSQAAQALVFILFLYYEIYRWIPLGRWNAQFRWPVQNDQFYPDIVIGLLLLSFLYAFYRSWRPGMWAAVVLLGLWVVVHFLDWWLPYLHNSAANYPRYHFYASHTQILPVVQNHYPPDAGHAILDFILFPAWLFCLAAASSRRHRAS